MNKITLVLLGILASSLAQIMLKKSGEFPFFKEFYFFVYFAFGGLFYFISFVAYASILKVFNLSKISPIMTIATMLLVVLAGYFLFKEEISAKQAVGVALGALSIFLLVK